MNPNYNIKDMSELSNVLTEKSETTLRKMVQELFDQCEKIVYLLMVFGDETEKKFANVDHDLARMNERLSEVEKKLTTPIITPNFPRTEGVAGPLFLFAGQQGQLHDSSSRLHQCAHQDSRPCRADALGLSRARHSQVKAAADVDLDQSGSGTVSMDIPAEGGSYRVVATARAPSGRQPEGSSAVWVSGGIWDVESENPTAQIIPDKKSYAAGDTARLLIATGEPDTPVWVAVEGQQVRQQKLLRSHESTVSFEIPDDRQR